MTGPAPRHWISVVSREHVLLGVAGGFAMMNHGKLAPLQRLSPGDGLAYYSPKTAYPDGAALKAFTAIGTVGPDAPYAAEMPSGMRVFRREIDWFNARETPISDLTDRLEFTRGNWGMLARRGLFEVSDADFQTIRTAMLQE